MRKEGGTGQKSKGFGLFSSSNCIEQFGIEQPGMALRPVRFFCSAI